jgi:integrase
LSEVVALIERAPTDLLHDAITIAALSGLRAGEIAALIKLFDCKDGMLTVHVGKSAAASRKVPIHSQLRSIIDNRAKTNRSGDYLLPELNGSAKSLVKQFARYRAQLHGKCDGQAEKTFHSFGHHCIDERLKAGCDLYLVQELAGHKLQGVTLSHYYHGLSVEQMVGVVEAVRLPL